MNSSLAFPFSLPISMIEAGFRVLDPTFHMTQSGSSFPSSARMIQKALTAMHATLTAMQSSLQAMTGQDGEKALAIPPLDGPQNIDAATADFANRLACIMRITVRQSPEMGKAFHEALAAARKSFRYLDSSDPRNLVFPLQFVLAMGTLLAETGLRGLVSYEAVGAQHFPKFCADILEIFTDNQLYANLEYPNLLAKYEAWLARTPDNDELRFELGHTQIKCGLYEQAASNLLQAAGNPSVRERALYDAAVALFRAGRLEEAARAASGSLAINPGNQRARGWLWLTAHKMGGYPDYIPPRHHMELKVGFEKPTVEFEDIAAKIGLDKTSGGRGIAVFDYNNDGLLDVVIACAYGGCNLYRNNGDGTFTDVSVESGLDTAVNIFVVIAGDYNNDGYVDLFMGRLGWIPGEGQLYRNNGDGTFTDVTAEAGLKMWGPVFSASWVDYDLDGNLDLFVPANTGGMFDRKTPNRLFHNNGDGTFTDVTKTAGLFTRWPTIGSAWGDYNEDGYPDLFLSNGVGQSQLYRNNGNGTFSDVSSEAGVDGTCMGTVCTWCDYNNDGRLDLLQFIWSDHEDVLHTLRHGKGPLSGTPARIYHNNGDGTFTRRDRDIGLTGCWGTMSANVGDFNNDGYLDLALGNGSPKMDRLEPAALLEYDGTRFHNVTFAAGLPFIVKGHGCTMADLFGDGRLSVLLGSGGAYPGDLLTTRVFCPKRLPGNYLNVRLRGVKSNCSAIGARVILTAGARQQYREISGGCNFGCLPLEQHFGLNDLEKIESVQVRWPSGLLQKFTDLPVNQTLLFIEGEPTWERIQAVHQKSVVGYSKT
jgi:tetratricopeptide (TPR) repeat protein